MPLVDSNDPAVWDSLYDGWTADGRTRAHYDRIVKDRILGADHWRLRDALALQPGQRIALIGAGFGWVAEDWAASGLGPIVAVDTSTYIQSRKVTEAAVTVYAEDVTTTQGRRALKQALGGTGVTVDWAITEDVLPVLSDAECVQLDTFLRNWAVDVAHWISVGTRRFDDANAWAGDARLNWKDLAGWKALVPLSRCVRRGSAEVL